MLFLSAAKISIKRSKVSYKLQQVQFREHYPGWNYTAKKQALDLISDQVLCVDITHT